MRYAIVGNGLITNVVEWDGESDWSPPEGHEAIADENGEAIVGGTYVDKNFIAPAVDLSLADAREFRFLQIDAKTDRVIGAGFTYAGKTFSLSLTAQNKIIGLYVSRAMQSFPIRFNTIDDVDAVDLETAEDIEAMFVAAAVALRTAVDSGTAIKDLVRSADTVEDVLAVEDNR